MNNEFKKAYFCFWCIYFMGILPIYWDLIEDIGAFEILALELYFQ